MSKTGILFVFFCFILFSTLHARQPYHASVSVGPISVNVSAPNYVVLFRELRTQELQELLPFYTPISPVTFEYNLRGIEAIAAFPAASPTLLFTIPQLGISEAFTGATRDDSLVLLKSYLRENADNNDSFLRAFARYTAIDPMAGNPNSLMSQMGQADYLLGRLAPFTGCDPCWSAQPIVHQYQIGAWAGRAFSSGFDTTIVSFPLRYSYSPNLKNALIIDAPFSLIKNGGAYSAFGSIGFGYRMPITHFWALTPTFRLGTGGSLDLVTGSVFVSPGLVSNINFKWSNVVASMTNSSAYYCSTNFWLGGVNFDYHLHNWVFKNGLALTTCDGFCLRGRPLNVSLTFIDTVFTGDPLYVNHYDEVGINFLITGVNPCFSYDCLSAGFSYVFGQHQYRSYNFNLTYQF